MIQIKYKTNAQKCIEANAKAYKRKPVFKRARQVKKELQATAEMIEHSTVLYDIDFKMF
jgi:hypothetical protein